MHAICLQYLPHKRRQFQQYRGPPISGLGAHPQWTVRGTVGGAPAELCSRSQLWDDTHGRSVRCTAVNTVPQHVNIIGDCRARDWAGPRVQLTRCTSQLLCSPSWGFHVRRGESLWNAGKPRNRIKSGLQTTADDGNETPIWRKRILKLHDDKHAPQQWLDKAEA